MSVFVIGSFIQACCWHVTRLPMAGESVAANSLHIEPGGKGLNVAIASRRLGAQVGILLGLGQDAAANQALEVLNANAVHPIIAPRVGLRSGHGAGLIAEDGQNMVSVFLGANLGLAPSHVAVAATDIQSAGVVYAQFETSLTAIDAAFARAYQAGAYTILNPSPWQTIPPVLLANTRILVVNQLEAAHLLGMPDSDVRLWHGECQAEAQRLGLQSRMQDFIAQWQGALLVITLGQAGCVAITRDQAWIEVPAFEVNVEDSLGAGDSFAAGLCVALAQGQSFKEALTFANACGALAATKRGVLDALPTLEEVVELCAQHVFTFPA